MLIDDIYFYIKGNQAKFLNLKYSKHNNYMVIVNRESYTLYKNDLIDDDNFVFLYRGDLEELFIGKKELYEISYKVKDIYTLYIEWRKKIKNINCDNTFPIIFDSGIKYARYSFSNFADLNSEITFEEMNQIEQIYNYNTKEKISCIY
ncbi:hypothetical protein [Clostridium butyricum]|uniref:hypothetical protein n=1 Tax=Clostridium butyricum TaxID=1492 RepID=UPI002AB1F064|nr:hypothetical protein [Clostridium butyricum]